MLVYISEVFAETIEAFFGQFGKIQSAKFGREDILHYFWVELQTWKRDNINEEIDKVRIMIVLVANIPVVSSLTSHPTIYSKYSSLADIEN